MRKISDGKGIGSMPPLQRVDSKQGASVGGGGNAAAGSSNNDLLNLAEMVVLFHFV